MNRLIFEYLTDVLVLQRDMLFTPLVQQGESAFAVRPIRGGFAGTLIGQ